MSGVDLLSIAVKVGLTFVLLFVTLRLVARFYGGGRIGSTRAGVDVRVLGRTTLTKSAQIAVVEMSGRRYAVGVTAQGVSLLAELDEVSDDLDLDLEAETSPTNGRLARTPDPVLRPSWRDLMESLRERTVRR